MLACGALCAQFGPPRPPPPAPGKPGAPVDLTGYWVAYVTEDWRWRMVTPLKGDAASIPTNAEARKVIDAWDPAKDEAAGLQCKSYGAPAIMRVPGTSAHHLARRHNSEDRDRRRPADSLAPFFRRSAPREPRHPGRDIRPQNGKELCQPSIRPLYSVWAWRRGWARDPARWK